RRRNDGSDLRGGGSASREQSRTETRQPVEAQPGGEDAERASAETERLATRGARAQVCLQRAPLGSVERARSEPLHGPAVQAVAEFCRECVRDRDQAGLHALRHAALAQGTAGLQHGGWRDVVAETRFTEQVPAVGGEAVGVPAIELIERSRLARGEAAAENLI